MAITLRAVRKRRKLTQVQLAEKTALQQTHISKLELNKIASPSYRDIVRCAVALNVTVDRIAPFEDFLP